MFASKAVYVSTSGCVHGFLTTQELSNREKDARHPKLGGWGGPLSYTLSCQPPWMSLDLVAVLGTPVCPKAQETVRIVQHVESKRVTWLSGRGVPRKVTTFDVPFVNSMNC